MLYRTQQWLPWNINICKTSFATLPPWILKSSFGSIFLHFQPGSTFHRVRMHRKLASTSGHHQKEMTFHSTGHPPSLCKIGASISSEDVHPAGWTWVRFNSILTQQKASLHSDVVTGSEVVSGLATEHTQNGFWWAHMRVWNYKQHSG